MVHGLFRKGDPKLMGVVQWLPPTRVAAESIDYARWRDVLALSRMAVAPEVPKNGCSFLLAKAIADIKKGRRWVWLLTYADESQGHEGHVYRASNWRYLGRTRAAPRWVDLFGRQVATQATTTRTRSQMEDLGYLLEGRYSKHKFAYLLHPLPNADLFYL